MKCWLDDMQVHENDIDKGSADVRWGVWKAGGCSRNFEHSEKLDLLMIEWIYCRGNEFYFRVLSGMAVFLFLFQDKIDKFWKTKLNWQNKQRLILPKRTRHSWKMHSELKLKSLFFIHFSYCIVEMGNDLYRYRQKSYNFDFYKLTGLEYYGRA